MSDFENDEKFDCSYCEKVFHYRKEFNKHVMGHRKVFKCEFCTKTFTGVKCRAKHYYASHREEKLKCDSCNIMYHKIKDIEKHKKFHAKEFPYLCLLCLKCFPNLFLLREHLHMHEKEARKLVTVKKIFDNDSNEVGNDINEMSSLQTGAIKPSSNHVSEGYMCDCCGKVFAMQRSLHKHSHTHESKGSFKCDVCEKMFEYKYKLIAHMSYHSRNPKSRSIAERKMKSNVKVRPLCHTCGKSFCDDRQLRRHKEYHLPEGHFPCKLCDKVFDLNIKLKFHMTHHRRKARGLTSLGKMGTFPCEVCGKVFFYYSNFNTHRQLHKDKYNCTLCTKVFNKKWNLKTHMAIHLGEKPYSCSYCGASYADRSNLKKHLMKHPIDVEAKAIVTRKSSIVVPSISIAPTNQ